MASGAYGANRASDTDFRKKWDKEEFAEKARLKDQEERERLQENEQRIKQGAFLSHARRSTFAMASQLTYRYQQGRNLARGPRRTFLSLRSS